MSCITFQFIYPPDTTPVYLSTRGDIGQIPFGLFCDKFSSRSRVCERKASSDPQTVVYRTDPSVYFICQSLRWWWSPTEKSLSRLTDSRSSLSSAWRQLGDSLFASRFVFDARPCLIYYRSGCMVWLSNICLNCMVAMYVKSKSQSRLLNFYSYLYATPVPIDGVPQGTAFGSVICSLMLLKRLMTVTRVKTRCN